MDKLANHNEKVKKIVDLIKKSSLSGENGKLRFYHGSTNSTRPKNKGSELIDTSDLNEVLEVNINGKYALVEPKVSMEELVEITSKYNLIPAVVMEFPKITVGGGINGASLESSSFKYGQLSDTCEEYEIILGNGEVVTASSESNSDLFYGISGSYGSLGVLSLVKIRIIDSSKYIKTIYYPTTSFKETLDLIKDKTLDKEIDYLDAIIYSATEGVVITGKLSNDESSIPRTYSKINDLWFYERGLIAVKNKSKEEELIPVIDYFFRYNRGAFWMGEFAFPLLGIPNNKLTRFLFNEYAKTHKLYEALHTLNVSQTYFLQDVYFPIEETLNCLKYNEKSLGIYPLWLCPVKPATTPQKLSPHYIESGLLIDVGIWGQTDKFLEDPIKTNRDFEKFSKEHKARKMLYAHAYYSREEFWQIYDKNWYESLRKKYFADKAFPDVWEKTHVSGKLKSNRWFGFFKYFFINPLKKYF